MIDAVRCADRLIAEFIEDVRNTHPDIVVASFTDHLMGNAGFDDEVTGYLMPNAEERRLRFDAGLAHSLRGPSGPNLHRQTRAIASAKAATTALAAV